MDTWNCPIPDEPQVGTNDIHFNILSQLGESLVTE